MKAGVREQALETFIAGLTAAQFRKDETAGRLEYVGSITTPVGERRVRVLLPATYPYHHPWVFPLDAQYARWGRHQMARENGALCLWESDGERAWDPSTTVDAVLQRAAAWFEKNDNDTWAADERPPDLQYSFPDMRHLIMTGSDWPPGPGEFGRMSVWDCTILSLAARPAQRYDTVAAITSTDELPVLVGEKAPSTLPIGLWFRLPNEPRPCPTLGAMLEEIAGHLGPASDPRSVFRGTLGEKVREKVVVVVGIGYPDPRSGDERWLFVDARASVGKSADLKDAELRSYEHAPADRTTLTARSGHLATTRNTKHVVIFGLGALGSPLAVTLARAGVGTFDLFDGDVLRPGNVVRHAASMVMVGFEKTWATSAAIKQHTPYVTTDKQETTWDSTVIDAAIRRADLVIDATATAGFTLLLAERCLAAGKSLLWLTAQRSGQIGRVRLLRPGRDPCPQCQRPSEDATLEPAVPPIVDAETVLESGCGAPTSAASPADLERIAVSAAQLALRLLDGRSDAVNQIWVVNEPISGGDAPLDVRGVFEHTLPRADACALCGVA